MLQADPQHAAHARRHPLLQTRKSGRVGRRPSADVHNHHRSRSGHLPVSVRRDKSADYCCISKHTCAARHESALVAESMSGREHVALRTDPSRARPLPAPPPLSTPMVTGRQRPGDRWPIRRPRSTFFKRASCDKRHTSGRDQRKGVRGTRRFPTRHHLVNTVKVK